VTRVLDLTRLVSRLGRGPLTGIDRVEYAYLVHLLALDRPIYGLVRTAAGFVLLNHAGCAGLAARVNGTVALGKTDLIGRLLHRRNPTRACAEADMRRLAVARVARPFLHRMLRRFAGATYLNVGHANLTDRGLAAIRKAGLKIAVLVHDTIPLDHPEFARPDTVEPFRRKLAAVAASADLIIHTTQDACAKTNAQLARLGRVPPGVIAPLGVPVPVPGNLPSGIPTDRPYFVTIGTIEPRKNHALLLDIWDQLGPDAPRLYIIGARGWASAAVMARLDGLPQGGPVQVLSGLDDSALGKLLANARALLFPSLAEGFGLPPVEAAALGVRVVASNLAVIRELVGEFAVYLDVTDSYSWMETIKTLAMATQATTGPNKRMTPPEWADHFKTVLIGL
jgi:glycosyltransferase involved in cell wall biosynthesis